jgi:hypothetical protein
MMTTQFHPLSLRRARRETSLAAWRDARAVQGESSLRIIAAVAERDATVRELAARLDMTLSTTGAYVSRLLNLGLLDHSGLYMPLDPDHPCMVFTPGSGPYYVGAEPALLAAAAAAAAHRLKNPRPDPNPAHVPWPESAQCVRVLRSLWAEPATDLELSERLGLTISVGTSVRVRLTSRGLAAPTGVTRARPGEHRRIVWGVTSAPYPAPTPPWIVNLLEHLLSTCGPPAKPGSLSPARVLQSPALQQLTLWQANAGSLPAKSEI